MSSQEASHNNITVSKSKAKNEKFYTQKRALIRKADQIQRQSNCEVFFVIHHKELDKVFTYTSSEKDFPLERATYLILRDVQASAFLNKNKKFEETDFEQVRKNVKQYTQIASTLKLREHSRDSKTILSSGQGYTPSSDLSPSQSDANMNERVLSPTYMQNQLSVIQEQNNEKSMVNMSFRGENSPSMRQATVTSKPSQSTG